MEHEVKDMGRDTSYADKALSQADNLDSAALARSQAPGTSSSQLVSQISLGVGSAVLGAISWMDPNPVIGRLAVEKDSETGSCAAACSGTA
jgi:hypothetical protein